MNKVILMGRLTRDPMVSYTQGERSMAIARFTLAVDRRFIKRDQNNPEQQTADFIQCVAFDKRGEFVEKYLHQGTKIVLEGHIQTGSYTNKDGQRVYTTEVIVDNMEFAESKAAQNRANSDNGSYVAGEVPQQPADADGFMSIPDGVEDEGLPFN